MNADTDHELGLRLDHAERAVLWVREGRPGEYLRIDATALEDLGEAQ